MYTPAYGNRELHYILRDYFLFRDIVIFEILAFQTSDFGLRTSDFRLESQQFCKNKTISE